MPSIKSRYAENWDAIALQIKRASNWTCQECGRPCREPGWDWDLFLQFLLNDAQKWSFDVDKPGRFILTVAHLNQDPSDNSPENLKALCAPCHLRYDAPHRKSNREKRQEYLGQMNLLEVSE